MQLASHKPQTTVTSQTAGAGAFATAELANKRGGNRVTRVLAKAWPWGSHTLAQFPSVSLISVRTICSRDEKFGSSIQGALEEGLLENEEQALQLWLILHRALKSDSPYAPYISTLPPGTELPVNYGPSMLLELSGTEAIVAVEVSYPRKGQNVHWLCGLIIRWVHQIVRPMFCPVFRVWLLSG
jgi:hypothetical protein